MRALKVGEGYSSYLIISIGAQTEHNIHNIQYIFTVSLKLKTILNIHKVVQRVFCHKSLTNVLSLM